MISRKVGIRWDKGTSVVSPKPNLGLVSKNLYIRARL